jgi:CDP-glucose 4,6-dehydratase
MTPGSRFYTEGLADRICIVKGQVEDTELIERVINEHESETVFHLAAQTIVGVANRSPISTFEANIQGTWSVLDACRRVGSVKQVLVASSDKAYGAQPVLPYTEDMPLMGSHPYDVSKSCTDLIARSYFETYGLPVCITRFGNFYGPGDLNFSRLIPQTIRSVIREEAPVIRSDGKSLRDYVYIEDAASGYMLLAEKFSANSQLAGEAFNFSSSKPRTVIEVVRTILKLMGRPDLKPRVLNTARNEIPSQHLDSSKARETLGWNPAFTLEQGLARTVQWYRALLNGNA